MSMLHVQGIGIMVVISLLGRSCLLLGLILCGLCGRHRLLVSGVGLHLPGKAFLVLGGQGLEFLLFLSSEGTPALAQKSAHIGELDVRIFLHNFRTHLGGKEYVRSTSTLGSVGVPALLLTTTLGSGVFFQEIAIGIMTRWGNVGLHLIIVPSLVLRRPLLPHTLLLRGQGAVHVRGILGQLTKGHARIILFELLAHGVLVEEVGGHVALGGVGVTDILPTLSTRARLGNDGVALGIVARWGNILR